MIIHAVEQNRRHEACGQTVDNQSQIVGETSRRSEDSIFPTSMPSISLREKKSLVSVDGASGGGQRFDGKTNT